MKTEIPTVKYSAIIFDMDGVITDTMGYHCRAWKKVFKNHGALVSDYEIYKREGQKGINSVKEIFADHGIAFNQTEGLKILDEKEVLFKQIVKQKFITGARSFLKNLYRNNIRLALVTGTARHEVHKILPQRIQDYFEVIISGCDVKKGKPHPEPYLKALKKMNVSAQNAIVIENAPYGIASAKAAQLTCYALETSLNKKYLTQADKVFSNYTALTKELHIK